MASQGISRKRPAPGANPSPYPQQVQQPAMFNTNAVPQLSDDQFLQWGQSAQEPSAYQDASVYGTNSNSYNANNQTPSNQLTRRPPMSQVVTRPRFDGPSTQPWVEEPNSATDSAWADDIQELERKAQVAKKDAQAKRKQIPPFVQKLNSFLEDGKNTELIRWSDHGNSFVVLDEDEFAKTLIPELFKHNNYASFVRQLNMYGFHKKVGLSDNSMRASERKNKSPSEYSNPYFRRGQPDLLWLIQKPRNASGKKGKKDNDLVDDDADDYIDEPGLPQPPSRQRPPQLKQLGDGDSTLSQEQLQSIHQELSQIRSQQVAISKMMGQLKREQEQLYGQAATYQEQHNRHENSINAILTFLATIYNRSIQGHEGSQNIQNLFSAAIPHESQGTVVDVGDYNFDGLNGADGSQSKPFKKPPLLLTDGQSGRATTTSPSSGSSPFPPRQTRRGSQSMRNVTSPLTGAVEEVFDSAGNTPVAQPQSVRSSSAQPDFMSIIQNANARNSNAGTPAADFSSVLNNLENAGGQSPLTNSQRADVLRMMNNSSKQGGDNALINSTPPPGPSNFNRQLARTNADLERLAKLQAEQDKSVQNLTNLLQPLSPTGSIPGIHDGASLPPPPLDIDDFLNHNEYFNDFPSDGAGNYDFSGAGDVNGGTPEQGINFEYNNDDGELFGDLPPTSAETQDQNGSCGFGFDGADDDASEVKGRVESLTSSEATTPDSVQEEGDRAQGIRTSPRNTRKGRKLSSVEDEAPSVKRRRS